MSADNRQRELVRRCRKLGFRAEITGGGHWKVYAPLGLVFMPVSPSESQHGWKKDRNRLRRMGIPL